MQEPQAFENLVLPFYLSLERLQGLMGGMQALLRAVQYLLEFLRAPQIIIHACIVIFEVITEFAEDAFVESGCVRRGLEGRVIVQPLVCKEHFGIYVGHGPRPDDTPPAAGRQQECAHKGGKDDIFRQFPHSGYRRVAPNSLVNTSSSRSMTRSTSWSVRVFSTSCRVKLRAYCFLPAGILSPR